MTDDSPDSKQAGGAGLGAVGVAECLLALDLALEALLVLCPSTRTVIMCAETNRTLI